uniref:Methylthioribose-1-phosphate isomerase n=2 Tax=Ditylum brightwellii TaxID=49249 RepID=A0A7S4VUX8_9STRA
MASSNLQSLRYSNEGGKTPTLSVLDQLLIPDKKEYVDIPDVEAAWGVIRSMQIRGAPLIAIVACLGLSVDLATNPKTKSELDNFSPDDADAILSYISKKTDYLRTSRPTAVNLFNALDELTEKMTEAASASANGDPKREKIVKCVVQYAEFMLERDVSDNEAIGAHGADAILSRVGDKGLKMVTICNTGSLATAGFGTALGVVRELQRRNKLESITALETRPYNQGSRLTAFEIVEEKMPGGQLICDSMAASLMKTKGVDACVVGADRVCANGDTANKIGTYNLSIVAAAHDVPFYVASPFTTLDTKLQSGDDIEIEERPAKELLDTARAPQNIPCWNPSFDVTPAKYITGIITEKGVIEKSEDGTFDIISFVKKHS